MSERLDKLRTAVLRWWHRRRIRRKVFERPPETGVEIFIGRPGAGKSLVGVKRVLDAVQIQRRVVYTNLPFRWRVVKLFLRERGGPELAALIRRLTEEHFLAFLKRFAERDRFIQSRKSKGVGRAAALVEWEAQAGPDVVQFEEDPAKPQANWIPEGSVVVVDEVQAWTGNPAIRSGFKSEPPELLTWLTMHRHMQHWIWVFTQAERQVSASWKTIAERYWDVCDMGDERVAWGIRWRHLRIKALRYRCYSNEQWDVDNPGEPMKTFVIFPNLWFGSAWLFRLYDSFTHAGGSKDLRLKLERERMRAGLAADGSVQSEVEAQMAKEKPKVEVEEADVVPDSPRRKSGVPRFFLRWGVRLAVLSFLLLFVYGMGRGAGSRIDGSGVEAAADSAAPDLLVRMVANSAGRILMSDSARPARGGRWNKGTVLYANGDGLLLAGDDGVAYRWVLGGGGKALCGVDQLCELVERLGRDRPGASKVGSKPSAGPVGRVQGDAGKPERGGNPVG